MHDTHADETSLMRRWLTGKRLIGLAIAVLILARVLIAVIPIRLHIGPETTVIESPLRPDGTPDYAAYLNDEWSAGVAPENNAVVALIHVFGPHIVDAEIREAYFDRLGIPIPIGSGFLGFEEYLDAEALIDPNDPDRRSQLLDDFEQSHGDAWTADDYPEVAVWLDAHQAAVSTIVDASERPRYFSPLILQPGQHLLDALLPIEQEARTGARLLLSQAMRELGRGNVEEACELTLACHKLSRLISEHPTLIGQLVGYAIEVTAGTGDQAIVLSGLLTADQATAYREQLAALPPFRELADVMDRGERFMSLELLIAMHAGRISEEDIEAPRQLLQWGFNPNPVLVRFNGLYDDLEAALRLPDRTDRRLALEDLDRRVSNVERPAPLEYFLALAVGMRRFVSEQTGQVLCALLFPAIYQAANAEERTHIRVLLTDTGYALATYRAEHGAFAKTLGELVPDQLSAVPLDPVTGDPLKYARKDDGFLLYSVGNNGLNDGGLMDGDADDIAFGLRPEPATRTD